ncbi:dipeptidase [Pendulispora brunnea]|uniref:Dipeptidase n=1 Tax=Pendulispora brunnea TaxID=2905690 RepID=A0ABZ2JUX3_9BACT
MSLSRVTRRHFVQFASGIALSGCAGQGRDAQAADRAPGPKAAFDDGIIFDGSGGIGRYEWDPPLTASEIQDGLRSGLTCVSITVDDVTNSEHSFDHTMQTISVRLREIAAHPESLMLVRNAADVRAAKATKRVGFIFAFQGATALGPALEHFDLLYGLGVRVMQLTYNTRNLLGDGCLEAGNAGLSTLGRRAVERMNTSRVLIDVSHCGQRTTAEAIELSKQPIAITHTGCSAVVNHPRNKRDEELKRCADKGGVAGIYFMPFLRAQGQQMAADVIAHLEHAINVCGEDHVGIGSDGSVSTVNINDPAYVQEFRKEVEERRKKGISAPGEDPNVFPLCPDLNTPQKFRILRDKLRARGHGQARLDKIMGGNFARLFADVCG